MNMLDGLRDQLEAIIAEADVASAARDETVHDRDAEESENVAIGRTELASEALGAIEQADAALQTAEGWRSIETAPKDGRPFMVWNAPTGSPSVRESPICRRPSGGFRDWFTDDAISGQPFTHWMPFPPPPVTEGR